jgi:hypothetical protein
VEKASFDKKGRAIVNVRWIVGAGGVIPMTTMKKIIMLKRDYQDQNVARQMTTKEALDYLTTHDFCNPHQLVKDQRKTQLRKDFFERFLSKPKCT